MSVFQGNPTLANQPAETPLYEVRGECNLAAQVYPNRKGFAVAVYDYDAEMTLPTMKIFPTLEEAKVHADTMKIPA